MQRDGTNVEMYMVVNMRNRLLNCFDDDMGNYQTAIPYRRADFETPALIRESLSGDFYFRASRPTTKRSILATFLCFQF